jgi:hypothetical protein
MASALLGCKSFERGGRCGWASLPPAPSYDQGRWDGRTRAEILSVYAYHRVEK